LMVEREEEWGCSCVSIAGRQLPFRLHKYRPTVQVNLSDYSLICIRVIIQHIRSLCVDRSQLRLCFPHIRPILSIPLDVNFSFIQNDDIVCHRKHSNAHTITYSLPCSLTMKKLKKMDPPRVSFLRTLIIQVFNIQHCNRFQETSISGESWQNENVWCLEDIDEYARQTSKVPFTVCLLPLRVPVGCTFGGQWWLRLIDCALTSHQRRAYRCSIATKLYYTYKTSHSFVALDSFDLLRPQPTPILASLP
jgi:hypothetical protein